MNYPDNFTINIPPTDVMFDMVKLDPQFPDQIPQWGCSRHGQPYVEYRKTTYEAAEIAEKFAQGLWQEVSFKEPVERPLNYPFTVRVNCGGDHYDVVQGYKAGYVTMIDTNSGKEYADAFPEDTVRKWIKDGSYAVTSVGPRKATTAPPEPSKEAAKGMDSLTVSVRSEGFTEATEQAKKLAAAIEEVNIALESFQAIFEDTRELLLGGNPSGCVTFCCEPD